MAKIIKLSFGKHEAKTVTKVPCKDFEVEFLETTKDEINIIISKDGHIVAIGTLWTEWEEV